MSKNMAARHIEGLFRGKPEFSTGLVGIASDNVRLSRQAVHFCTFCVDKIVSKAARTCRSHWFKSDKLPCTKTKHVIFSVGAAATDEQARSEGIRQPSGGLGITPKFCTSSVDKIVRNTMLDELTLWFSSIYFLCVNFRHTKWTRRKRLSVTKVSHSICG